MITNDPTPTLVPSKSKRVMRTQRARGAWGQCPRCGAERNDPKLKHCNRCVAINRANSRRNMAVTSPRVLELTCDAAEQALPFYDARVFDKAVAVLTARKRRPVLPVVETGVFPDA